MYTFQNCELLAEGKVLQHEAAATAKSANDGSAPEPKQVKHGSQVIADGILGYVPMLLNSKVDGIVTRDTVTIDSSPLSFFSITLLPMIMHLLRFVFGDSTSPSLPVRRRCISACDFTYMAHEDPSKGAAQ